VTAVSSTATGELGAILSDGLLAPVFQPIVDLDTARTIGYEALARVADPHSPLGRPELLFGAARAANRLPELDWACRLAALHGALDGGLTDQALFVNVEPDVLGSPAPPAAERTWFGAPARLPVVLEVTERALTARPAELLEAVARLRKHGWRIALDDVGADSRSLALMPLLQPDVIKLDLRLVQERPNAEVAAIMTAVSAERERSGAHLLAEGIETEEHLAAARALGATLGQGWYFGRPTGLPAALEPPPPFALGRHRLAPEAGSSPYGIVSRVRPVRRAEKPLLVAISKLLEQQALALGATGVIVGAFQLAERFTPDTCRRYSALGAGAAFVAALGVGMDVEPAPRVRGASLAHDDVLLGEWSVAVVGPHFAAALVATDLGDNGPQRARRFDFALTYDRNLVVRAAASLMRRVAPVGLPPPGNGLLPGERQLSVSSSSEPVSSRATRRA